MRRFALAHINFLTPVDLPDAEQQRHKILAALSHMSGLGKVLRYVELDLATMADEECDRAREMEELTEGIQAIGDLIAILSDTAWAEVEEMFDPRRQQSL